MASVRDRAAVETETVYDPSYEFLNEFTTDVDEDAEIALLVQGLDNPRFVDGPSDPDYFTRPSYALKGGLRPYQDYGVKRIFEEWIAGKRSTYLVLPTGTGKTRVVGTVIKHYPAWKGPRDDGSPRRTLVLAHRDYLLEQAANEFAAVGVDSAIEKGERRARLSLFGNPQVVIASVGSMQANDQTERLLTWPRDYFDLIVTDEGHHGPSPSYRRIYDHFLWSNMVFVTATDVRLDGISMGSVCQSKAWEYPMFDAVKAGWLSPIRIRWIETDIDLSKIRTTKFKDFNARDLTNEITPRAELLCRAIKANVGDRQTIVYCPDVKCAKYIARALTGVGIPSESLDGKSKNRESVLDAFRGHYFQTLVNCQLFDEGFDVPDVSAIVMLCPTMSLGRYKQRLGRGTRWQPGKTLLLVDFTWSSKKHSLIKPADIFRHEDVPDAWVDEANTILQSGDTDDLMSSITKAERIVTEREEWGLIEPEVRDGKVRYREVEYDPFNLDESRIEKRVELEPEIITPATENQKRVLRRNGFDGVDGMSAQRAGLWVGIIRDRARRGVCSFPQRNLLVKFGIDPKVAGKMKFTEASETIARLKGQPYARVDR